MEFKEIIESIPVKPYFRDEQADIAIYNADCRDKCWFDKKGNFHPCNQENKDCIGCKHEKIIARSVTMLCHWCGKEICANRLRAFCNINCRLMWQSARLSYDSALDGGLFWSEGIGVCPIFETDELKEAQRKMLGYVYCIL